VTLRRGLALGLALAAVAALLLVLVLPREEAPPVAPGAERAVDGPDVGGEPARAGAAGTTGTAPGPGATVEGFLEALRRGDVDRARELLTDPLLGERRTLLERNPSYPAFLRDHYARAAIEIETVRRPAPEHAEVEASLRIEPGAAPEHLLYLLRREGGAWKIAGEEAR
jgi:hypothetical protein